MTNDKLFNILEYLIDNLEWYGAGKHTGIHEACVKIRNELFSNEPDGLTFDVIPKIPTNEGDT